MPKRGITALAFTTIALVLLLSFKTPDDALPARRGGVAVVEPGSDAVTRPGALAGRRATPTPPESTQGAPTTQGGGGGTATTVDGPVVSTRFGEVQVEIDVAGGKITDVVALQLPTDRRSGQISRYVEPILRQEALTAQSASIDFVSGATYTSDAYTQSLQAALDQAGLK
jgi:uncharacterized protein with FMN-binding domain